MEINNLLCIGRGSLSNFGYVLSKRKLSESSLRSEDSRRSASASKPDLDLSEKELIAKMPTTSRYGSLSPQTKSILRGKVPCPSHGSPSSLRSVRFSDTGGDDDAVFAKIHVNETVQTDAPRTSENAALNLDNLDMFTEKLKETQQKSEKHHAHQMTTSTPSYDMDKMMLQPKTSTPRFDKGTPAPAFMSPLKGLIGDTKSPREASPARPVLVYGAETQDERSSTRSVSSVSAPSLKRSLSPEISYPDKRSVDKQQTLTTSALRRSFTVPFEHKGRLVVDINIDRKIPTEYDRNSPHRDTKGSKIPRYQPATPRNVLVPNVDLNYSNRLLSSEKADLKLPDGSRIIRNLDLSDLQMNIKSAIVQTGESTVLGPRSASPEQPSFCQDAPDGKKIIQNMELNSLESSLKLKSESTQTQEFPEGQKIIQNMKLGELDSSLKMKSEGVQTIKIPNGHRIVQNLERDLFNKTPKSVSIEVQTSLDIDEKKESFKDVPVQVDFDDSPEASPDSSIEEPGKRSIAIQVSTSKEDFDDSPKGSPNSSIEESRTRSIAIQVSTSIGEDIPDGTKIVKNLELSKHKRHQELSTQKPHYTESRPENRSLNDGNWNEFVRHLELFNPSSSSSSVSSDTGEEPHPSPRVDPVLVYNKNALTGNGLDRKGAPTISNNVLSERNAQSYLRSDTFKRDKYQAVLKEEGLLDKFMKEFKSPVSNKVPPEKFALRASPILWKPDVVKPQVIEEPKSPTQARPEQLKSENLQPVVCKNLTEMAVDEEDKTLLKKEHLGFTPIETYSFSPDKLETTTTNIAHGAATKKPTTGFGKSSKERMPARSLSFEKESTSKNAFIKGLDLGPAPKPATVPRYSSVLKDFDTFHTTRPVTGYDLGSYSLLQNKPMPSTLGVSKSQTYIRPSTAYTDDMLQGRLTSRPLDRYQRPSSAESSKYGFKSSLLTPSLKDMRKSAVRKSALGLLSQQKPLNWDRPSLTYPKHFSSSELTHTRRTNSSTGYSKTSHSGDSLPRSKEFDSSKISQTDTLPKTEFNSSTEFAGQSFRPRQVSSDKPTYLEALHSESNQRPSSRERSRSRSRSPEPRALPDAKVIYERSDNGYTTSHVCFNESTKVDEAKDRRYFDPIVTKGFHEQPSQRRVHSSKMNIEEAGSAERESRSLARKPPLPNNRKSSRSRSRSHSSDRILTRQDQCQCQESRSEATIVLRKPELDKEKVHHRNPIVKGEMQANIQDHAKQNFEPNCSQSTITIGHVPSEVINKDCMYLGHDSIQKIIEEAKL